jgi:hypothetical protein
MWLILAGLISVTINPRICNAPCTVVLTLKVEPAKDNEKVTIEFVEGEGADYIAYRISDIDYSNGGPKTVQIKYPAVPAGNYWVKASLFKHDGKTWLADSDKKTLNVVGIQ